MSLMSNGNGFTTNGEGEDGDHDPHFEPIIYLPEVHIHSNEEAELVLISLRAKLFRHDKAGKLWKERGTGEVKLLLNEDYNTVRVVMRRDKTLKLCANHYVTEDMEMSSHCGSDRAYIWTTPADVADGEPSQEVLAIRFQNTDAAKSWKDKFEEAKSIVAKGCPIKDSGEKDAENDSALSDNEVSSEDEVTQEVSKLSLSTKDRSPIESETEADGDKPSN